MTWDAGDIIDLKYLESTFDLPFDKGTLDALINDKKGPWDYGPEVQNRLQGYIASINRVLATKGIWIIISYHLSNHIFCAESFNLIDLSFRMKQKKPKPF